MMKQVESKKVELNNCHFVKTVLILVVVLYHSILFWSGNWFDAVEPSRVAALDLFAQWLNRFHIYGFTFASGYIFYYTQHERGGEQSFLSLIKGKAMRLLIPYAFTALCWVIPTNAYFYGFSASKTAWDFLLAVSPAQLWFLWMLMVVFVIMGLLDKFVARHDWLGAATVGVLYLIGMVGEMKLPNVFQVWTGCQFVVYFWVGFKLRQHGMARLRRIPVIAWVPAHVVLFAVVRSLPAADGIIMTFAYKGLGVVLNVLGALMAFMVLQWLAERVRWQESKVFGMLQRSAMPVYLFCQQVTYWVIVALNGLLNPYLHAAVNFAAALFVSVLISWVLMRFRVTRFLIGEK